MSDRSAALLEELSEFKESLAARPPRAARWTGGILAAMTAAAFGWLAIAQADLVVRANGRIRPVAAPQNVKARFGGRVTAVYFREGQQVKKGDVLCRLDTEKLDDDARKREASVAAGRMELARMDELARQQDRQHEAELETLAARREEAVEEADRLERRRVLDKAQAKVDVESAERELERMKRLAGARAASTAEVEKAATMLAEAQNRLSKAELPTDTRKVLLVEKERRQSEEANSVRKKDNEVKRLARFNEIEGLRRELESLAWEKDHAAVRSPIDGIVTAGVLREGELVEAGRSIADVAPDEGFIFEAQVKSDEVANLKAGLAARVKVDAYDANKYGAALGEVAFVSPDSSGEGSAAYRVQVKLAGDALENNGERVALKLGMAGYCDIVTARETLLAIVLRHVRRTVSFG
ncbi:MAG TPA: HlyD family efflux transporter periplasmic adaptor subunit [Planctomycetia bacterium]|nr:HlyD family efflux transporter periplasmic adaptor subunit [Planctomycetia bacterium]